MNATSSFRLPPRAIRFTITFDYYYLIDLNGGRKLGLWGRLYNKAIGSGIAQRLFISHVSSQTVLAASRKWGE